MSVHRLKIAKGLKAVGEKIGRSGMSERAIAAIEEFDGTYKGAMRTAGRLKAITQMAKCDEYWSEQVDRGFQQELNSPPKGPTNDR